MDSRVYAVRCAEYAQVGEKLSELLSLMGGMEKYAKAGERLALKVNLLQPAAPEKAISTHPAVAAAVAASVRAAGAAALIAECPGAGYKHGVGILKKCYDECGMTGAAAESGAELNFDVSREEVSFPQGVLMRHFEVMSPILKCDGVLNLCKLKTHMFMNMTGAVKNNFGVIPGLSKVGYHAKLQDKEQFAGMLLDLCAFVSPRLSVMDAVVAMEGEGPGASGVPRKVGLLLASEDPLALDVVGAEIIGLERSHNPLLLCAERRGMFPTRIEDVELVGISRGELRVPGFQLPASAKKSMVIVSKVPGPISALVKSVFTQKPRIAAAKCVGCGICKTACPAGAITLTEQTGRKAKINAGKCVRCYCCHELCPQKAVEVKRGVVSRLLG